MKAKTTWLRSSVERGGRILDRDVEKPTADDEK